MRSIPSRFVELSETIFGDDVSTGQHHRRIRFCRLLLGHWAGEDRVVSVLRRKWYLDLGGKFVNYDV